MLCMGVAQGNISTLKNDSTVECCLNMLLPKECTKESSVHIDNRGSIGQHHILTFLMVYTHCYISSDVLGKERLH